MALFSKLFAKIRGGATSASDWDEIQESLIGADLGAQSASEIIEIAKKAKGDEITVKFIPNAKNDERTSSLKIKKSRIVSTSCEDEDFDRRSDSEDSGSTNNNDESADD